MFKCLIIKIPPFHHCKTVYENENSLGVEVNADEEDGEKVPQADGEVRADLLVQDGREATGETGRGEEEGQEHRAQVRFKGPEPGLQREHGQGRRGPAGVAQEHRGAVPEYGLLRGPGTRGRRADRRYEPAHRRGPGRRAHRLAPAPRQRRGPGRPARYRRIRGHVLKRQQASFSLLF